MLYRNVPTQTRFADLPATTDVIVPVPDPYPGGVIDLADSLQGGQPSRDSRVAPASKAK